MGESARYVIITPVRDEENHVEATIQSICGQTVLPAQWVIVNDGSTDATGAIIDRYAGRYPWIDAVHRPNRGFRKSGGGVVEAFYDGYGRLRPGWDFLVKLDGDLSFDADYFEKCFDHFSREPGLGIGGGEIYHDVAGTLRVEANPAFHVRGATKIYRRACWEVLGGLWQGPGWDSIDELKANMLGWKTRSFPDLRVVHHRVTGSADGVWRDRVKHGAMCYATGYHPLFVLTSCLYRLARKPYVLGSVAAGWGFVKSYFTRTPRVTDREFVAYVRRQQLRRLCGMETIWK